MCETSLSEMILLHPLSFGILCFNFCLTQAIVSCNNFSLTHWLFRSVLFKFLCVWVSSISLLLLISSFVPLWSEKILGIISILNFLRFVLWPNIWSILENVSSALEMNVYSTVKVVPTKVYFISIAEAESPRSRCCQGWFLLMSVRKDLFHTSLPVSHCLLAIFDIPWLAGTSFQS